REFSHERRIPDIRHFRDHLLGGFFLLGRMVINDGAVLSTDIVALPVQRGGIVNGEEYFQDFAVADHRRIIGQPYHLCMPGLAFADLRIGWIRDLPAGITRLHLHYPFQFLVNRFQAPEASATQSRNFSRHVEYFLYVLSIRIAATLTQKPPGCPLEREAPRTL